MKCKKQIIISLFVIGLGLLSSQKVHAATNTDVNATIQISVCGNSVAENGEECDNTDLRNKTCQSLGFSSGTLTCDVSCSYDTTQCSYATPTPIVLPTSTPIPTANPVSNSQTTSTSNQTDTSVPTEVPLLPTEVVLPTTQPNTFISTLLAPIEAFPHELIYFGANKNGTIATKQLRASVTLWVTQWKKFLSTVSIKNGKLTGQGTSSKCDFNHDHVCNLVDLSIMLYHVQQ